MNPIIFIHIPKTGGTTVNSFLKEQFTPNEIFEIKVVDNKEYNTQEFIRLENRNDIKCIMGHASYGLHKYFNKPADYVTILRNPVDRIVSFYYHVLNNSALELNHLIQKNEWTIKDFVKNVDILECNNGQVNMLCGYANRNENTVQNAIENLSNHFSCIGVTEQLDNFIQKLCSYYSFNYVKIGILNKTINKPYQLQLDDETLACIIEYNKKDIELYNYVKQELC